MGIIGGTLLGTWEWLPSGDRKPGSAQSRGPEFQMAACDRLVAAKDSSSMRLPNW